MSVMIISPFVLAFADDAFESSEIRSPEDIYRISVPRHRNSYQIKWKPQILDVPVFRRIDRKHLAVCISLMRLIRGADDSATMRGLKTLSLHIALGEGLPMLLTASKPYLSAYSRSNVVRKVWQQPLSSNDHLRLDPRLWQGDALL